MKKTLAVLLAALLLACVACADAENGWRAAYIDFVRGTEAYYSPGAELFALIDLDGDETPELYYNSGYTAGGDTLVLFDAAAGARTELPFYNFGLLYVPGEGMFMDYGGHMDEYYHAVYRIVNGAVVPLGRGEFGAENNAELQLDANGDPVYRYYWNGVEVADAAAYDACLRAVIDLDRAVDPYANAAWDADAGRLVGPGLYGRGEIEEAIRDFVWGE